MSSHPFLNRMIYRDSVHLRTLWARAFSLLISDLWLFFIDKRRHYGFV